MFRAKLAAESMMLPLAFMCSIAAAQELPQNCTVEAPKSSLVYIVPPGDVYGSYVPYAGQVAAQSKAATACNTPGAPAAPSNSSRQVPASQATVADATPLACNTDLWVADKVYGPYVPYTGPLKACRALTEHTAPNSSPLNLTPSIELQPADPVKSAPPEPVANNLVAPLAGSTSEFIRSIPVPPAVTGVEMHPFKTYAIGFKADTLGAGIEIATPLAGSFNLRTSVNFLALNDPFEIDGVNYEARFHLQSSETVLDWFVGKGLHISPGILYAKNSMTASVNVGPGQTFVLSTQGFLNSVDDPVTGSSSVVFPHKFSPLLLIGYGNILPRSGRHLSFPVEIGAAYTGDPVIAVTLHGTACTTEGCFSFDQNQQAQTFLQQEVHKLNEDLKRFPVFPIVSVGVGYRF
jgi:hypothetical protein